jgi:O-antigen ligase
MTARGGVAWRWAPLLAAVAVAVAWRGGYTDDARGVVAALAGLAALAAVAVAPEAAGRAARHPIVLTLAALAVITALTAVWTIGAPSDAARDAAAILALCALVVAAASLPAPWGHAGILLLAALATAIAGLAATIATSEPLALNLCGSWRPAGPFEYPPALALVCAGAVPVALGAATERRRALAIPGALAAWLLILTVALTVNRSAVGLSALAVTACVALAPRGRAVGPAALAAIVAATASALILHGDLARAADGARVLALLPALIVVTVALWTTGARPGRWRRGRWTAAVAIAGLLATTGVVLGDRGSPCGGDPSHGRVGIWRAALHTAAERPLQGYGAGTFLAATTERQLQERPVPTRFAHDLALQEWVERGIAGLLAVIAWYLAVGWTLAVELWPPRVNAAAWLLAPAVAAFPLANLLDWPWALTATGALWAVAAGGLLAGRALNVGPTPS